MGNQFGWRATLRRPHLAVRETDLFGGTEFIVSDVLFKTMKGHWKKHRLSRRVPTEGQRWPCLLISS